ncbi:MAG TPA: hypothetical protein PKC41_07330, partial [Chitinophagaceae bacterium]|nr:hypothetical protein [Chitinophagaceae bacterium]
MKTYYIIFSFSLVITMALYNNIFGQIKSHFQKLNLSKLMDYENEDSTSYQSKKSIYYFHFLSKEFVKDLRIHDNDTVFFYLRETINKKNRNGYLLQIEESKGVARVKDKCPIVNGVISGICQTFSYYLNANGNMTISQFVEYQNDKRNGVAVVFLNNESIRLLNFKDDMQEGSEIQTLGKKLILYQKIFNSGKYIKTPILF